MATPEYGLQKDGSIAEIQKSDNSLSAQSLIFQKLNKGDAQTTQMRTSWETCYPYRSQTSPHTYWFRITKRHTQKSILFIHSLDDIHAQMSLRTTTNQPSAGFTLTTPVLQNHRALSGPWFNLPAFLPSVSSCPAHTPSLTTSTLLAISVSLLREASFVQKNPGPRTIHLLIFSTRTH